MKHGRKPTLKQIKRIKAAKLNPSNWLVSKNLINELHLVHRYTGTKRKVVA